MTNQQTYDLRTANGYSGTLTLVAYRVTPAADPPSLPYSGTRTVSCPVYDRVTANGPGERDLIPQVDAVVPLSFSLTYTTARFSSPVNLEVFSNYTESIGNGASYDLGSVGCAMEPANNRPGFGSNGPLSEGQTLHGDLFMLLPSFYSPTQPNGDQGRLRKICLSANVVFGTTGVPTVGPMPIIAGETC